MAEPSHEQEALRTRVDALQRRLAELDQELALTRASLEQERAANPRGSRLPSRRPAKLGLVLAMGLVLLIILSGVAWMFLLE